MHPQIHVTPVAESRLVDLRREGFGMAIRYTSGAAPGGLEVAAWIEEELTPVAAPSLIWGRLRTVDSLAGLAFLHTLRMHFGARGCQP